MKEKKLKTNLFREDMILEEMGRFHMLLIFRQWELINYQFMTKEFNYFLELRFLNF